MNILTYPIAEPAPPAGEIDRLQVLVQWSRSRLERDAQRILEVNPALLGLPGHSVSVKGFVVTVTFPPFVITQGMRPPMLPPGFEGGLQIGYHGEPIRAVGHVWLRVNEKEIDEEKELEHWLACRRLSAGSDAAQAFFLDLDERTLVPQLGPTPHGPFGDVTGNSLFYRLKSRAIGSVVAPISHGMEQPFDDLAGILTTSIREHFKGDAERLGTALDRFAAGWMRRFCETRDGRLRGLTLGGDADSAFLFFFAEFGLAMDDLDRRRRRTSTWLTYLNHFVRIQDIYLARWCGADPGVFTAYNGSVPIMQDSLHAIQSLYRSIGDDVETLVWRMNRNVKRLFRCEL